MLVAVVIGRIIVGIFGPGNQQGTAADLPIAPGIQMHFGIWLNWRVQDAVVPIGITTHWWNLPGTIVGLALALVSFRIVLQKDKTPNKAPEPTTMAVTPRAIEGTPK